MADKASEKIAEAAANIAEAAGDEIEEITERAETAIAEAAAKTEIAEQTARALTEAAIQTELGRQVDTVRKDLEACQTKLVETDLKMAALETLVTERLAQAQPSISIPLASAEEPPAMPEAEASMAVTDPSVVTLQSDEAGGGHAAAGAAESRPMGVKRRKI